jgi:AcrR family transcriptional regulator
VQKRTQARRKAIIEAGLRVFERDGFGTSSLREVAREAGVSHGTILNHFGSKDALLLEILQYRDDQWQVHLEALEADPLRLLLIVAHSFRNTPERAGMSQFFNLLISEAALEGHPAHSYFTWRYEWLQRFIGRIIAALVESGDVRALVDSDSAARTLIALMDGLQTQWLYADQSFDMSVDLIAWYQLILTEAGLSRFSERWVGMIAPVLELFDEIPPQPDGR